MGVGVNGAAAADREAVVCNGVDDANVLVWAGVGGKIV